MLAASLGVKRALLGKRGPTSLDSEMCAEMHIHVCLSAYGHFFPFCRVSINKSIGFFRPFLPRKFKRSEASNKIPIIQRSLVGRSAISSNCIAVTGLVCHESLGDLCLKLLVPQGSRGLASGRARTSASRHVPLICEQGRLGCLSSRPALDLGKPGAWGLWEMVFSALWANACSMGGLLGLD